MKTLLLQLLRVPPEPHPPAGSPESIEVFRAAPNYYYWTLFYWMMGQMSAFAGLTAVFVLIARASPKMPQLMQTGFSVLEMLIAIFFAVQLPISYWKQRLDYEMRWYIVTDRSLRMRSGIWSVQEMTMTFANLQKISVEQGPLEKLLGIATVSVTSAGGGSMEAGKGHTVNRHCAKFEGVDNAQEIRDLILERLRRYRDAGLGDPDDAKEIHSPALEAIDPLTAAEDVLFEARRVRIAISGRSL